jgi:hypothetical protein
MWTCSNNHTNQTDSPFCGICGAPRNVQRTSPTAIVAFIVLIAIAGYLLMNKAGSDASGLKVAYTGNVLTLTAVKDPTTKVTRVLINGRENEKGCDFRYAVNKKKTSVDEQMIALALGMNIQSGFLPLSPGDFSTTPPKHGPWWQPTNWEPKLGETANIGFACGKLVKVKVFSGTGNFEFNFE